MLGAAAMAAGIERLSLVNAFAQGSGYKALVCIFLGGGNDGNNLVVPLDGYPAYAAVRRVSATDAGLALAESALHPITVPSMSDATFGLHPSLGPIHPLWAAGKLAVVCNVGPLVEPLTKERYLANAPRPYQLFSHSDQIAQWQTSVSTGPTGTGWGGRIADTLDAPASGFPPLTALAGGVFTRGQSTSPLTVADARTNFNALLPLNGFGTAADEQARLAAFHYLRTIDRSQPFVAAAGDVTQKALDISKSLSTTPAIETVFPGTANTLGQQLLQVARLIKFNMTSPQPLSRQIFFCSLGGFDTHQNQIATQTTLIGYIGAAMKAFYDATVELGVEDLVTTFTLSDFGRTFQPAGSGAATGSDHAWGNHHLVMGGRVRGGDFYGVPGPNGTVFPTLALRGPDDTDSRGRWIPTASVDQYGATLASWFGVEGRSIDTVFPGLRNFSTQDLAFMS